MSFWESLQQYPVGDLIVGVLALIFALMGYNQGALGQLRSFVALGCALYLALSHSELIGSYLLKVWPGLEGNSSLSLLSMIVAFILGYIVGSLIMLVISSFCSILPFGFLGRLLGVVISLFKLWVILGIFVMLCKDMAWFSDFFPKSSISYQIGIALVNYFTK